MAIFAGRQKDLALIPPRLALGAAMLYHGAAKLKPEGTAQTVQFFEQLQLQPARPLVLATGAAEVFSGVCALAGVGTRLAALAVLVTQAVAVAKVHASKGFDIMAGGFEYNLALMGIAAGMLIAGPGRVSAHEGLERLIEARAPRGGAWWGRPSPALRWVKLVK
jgi:putative oxidoreductase